MPGASTLPHPVMIRLRLQMLSPLPTRRTSSVVAVGRAPQVRGEAPEAVDVTSLRMVPQLAGSHILDHTLAQRADGGISAHEELLASSTPTAHRPIPTFAIAPLSPELPQGVRWIDIRLAPRKSSWIDRPVFDSRRFTASQLGQRSTRPTAPP
jgi:hypothetical protein